MKILMIGGTSFFGRILVDKLLAAQHDVTLLTRGKNAVPSGAKHIQCDRTDYHNFKLKLAQHHFDVVIDNVVFDQFDVKSIIDVFAGREQPPQYVMCSSVAVYPDWQVDKGERLEDSATFEHEVGDDFVATYTNGKRSAEQYLQDNHGKMPFTVMRPAVIEGPDDPHKRTWFWVQRIMDGLPIILSEKDRQTKYRHVCANDVAKAFCLAVGNKKAYNEIFNVAGQDVFSIEEYVHAIAQALETDMPKLCWVSDADFKQALPGYELPPFFHQVCLTSSIDKIISALEYQPTKTSTWMQKTVQSLQHENTVSQGYNERDVEVVVATQLMNESLKERKWSLLN